MGRGSLQPLVAKKEEAASSPKGNTLALAAGTLVMSLTLASEWICTKTGLIGAPKLLFASHSSDARAMVIYVIYEVARCCGTHLGSFLILSGLRDRFSLLKDAKARSVLARSVMNISFLGACGYRGLEMWRAMAESKWPSSVNQLSEALMSKSSSLSWVPSTAYARLYGYYPDFQRLAAVMAAFQLKNTLDTLYYKDGWLFLLHHVIVVVVAYCALHPFAHFHGTFFFGVSETSTTLLALLANFDKDHGLPALERDYPNVRTSIGALFALSFLVVRGILWPYFSFFFIRDCLKVLKDNQAHDTVVVQGYIIMLATLSLMQILWLTQIAQAIYAEVFEPLFSKGKKTTKKID